VPLRISPKTTTVTMESTASSRPEPAKDALALRGSDADNKPTTNPPRKRQKKGVAPVADGASSKPTKLRGKRGLLKQLTEVPIDVLFEVCTLFLSFTDCYEHWRVDLRLPYSRRSLASSKDHQDTPWSLDGPFVYFSMESGPCQS
jgi:hypothetical protein